MLNKISKLNSMNKKSSLSMLYVIFTGMLFHTAALLPTDMFLLHDANVTIPIKQSYSAQNKMVEYLIPVTASQPVWGAALNAQVHLSSSAGMARILITDALDHDFLIYETWSLLQDTETETLQNACMESKALKGIQPVSVKVQVVDASITVTSINLATTPYRKPEPFDVYRAAIREEQQQQIIACLNRQIKKNGLLWQAGPTDLSAKTYEEKKCIFGRKDSFLHNLQGLEYYTGGTFQMRSGKHSYTDKAKHSVVVDTFDWRAKHGATNPQSPYYDGDSLLTGWATPIRNQALPHYCGSCWSHSTVATAEMMTNLYYNQQIDCDLSEHYLMTCSCAEACFTEDKPCSGGKSTKAAEWIVNHGVTDEENFPYQATDILTCSDSGANPVEHLYFAQGIFTDTVPSEDSLKQFLIHYGPLNIYIFSMWHCMSLVGYARDSATDQTTWIFKNSFGLMTGNNGYMHTLLSMDDLKSVDAFIPPVISKVYSDEDIRCVDLDSDGYYNWGIGPKPATCPDGCPDEEDCDDSRDDLGPEEPDGSCKILTPIHYISGSNTPFDWFVRTITPEGKVVINLKTFMRAAATVSIYSCRGAKIATLPLYRKDSSLMQCIWDGTNSTGNKVSDGVYVCRVALNTENGKKHFSFKLVR